MPWHIRCFTTDIVQPASKILISVAVVFLLLGFNSNICCIQGWSSNVAEHACCESGFGLTGLAAPHCTATHADLASSAAVLYAGLEPCAAPVSGPPPPFSS